MIDPTGHEVKLDFGEPDRGREPEITDFLEELMRQQERMADALERIAAMLEKQEERLKKLQEGQ
jgi:predicted nuclease with TOPRIM domain